MRRIFQSQLHPAGLIVLVIMLAIQAGQGLCAPVEPSIASLDTIQLNRYYQALADQVGREAWQRIDSKAKLEAERANLHREFMFMIGLDPLPERTPLQATVVRTVEREDYTVEVLHFQSLPGFYVTANLYRPAKGTGPFPAVVWGPGHGRRVRGQDPAPARCRLGQRRVYLHGDRPDPGRGDLWRPPRPGRFRPGRLVFPRLHPDRDRGLERHARGGLPADPPGCGWNKADPYRSLRRRPPELDGRGGRPAVRVVQPAAGTSDIPAHVRFDLQSMHCDCAYFINTYRHDWTTLAGLISPRPLLLHGSTGDDYYPPEGYLPVVERAREIFSWFGRADQTALSEVPGPHTYNEIQEARGVKFSARCCWAGSTKSRPSRSTRSSRGCWERSAGSTPPIRKTSTPWSTRNCCRPTGPRPHPASRPGRPGARKCWTS